MLDGADLVCFRLVLCTLAQFLDFQGIQVPKFPLELSIQATLSLYQIEDKNLGNSIVRRPELIDERIELLAIQLSSADNIPHICGPGMSGEPQSDLIKRRDILRQSN